MEQNKVKEAKEATEIDKWRYSLYAAIIFIVVALPFTYKITNNYLYLHTTDSNGSPTILGVIIHGIVFFLLIRLAMFLP